MAEIPKSPRLVLAQPRQEFRMAFHEGNHGVAVEQELHLK